MNSVEKKVNLNVLDLFCGAGGLSYGLELSGHFTTVLGLDSDAFAAQTFALNHRNAEVIVGDIRNTEIRRKVTNDALRLRVDMIVGGPPCQGFSLKGKNEGRNDDRNFLYMEYLKLVQEIKPSIFLIENVPSLVSSEKGYFISKIISDFQRLGYKVSYKILTASHFGVPQERRRVIILGSRSLDLNIQDIVPKNFFGRVISVKDSMFDLNYLNSGERSSGEYKLSAETNYQEWSRINSRELSWHAATSHSKIAVKKMKFIPECGNKKSIPEKFKTNQKFSSTWSRLIWEKTSPTIDTRFDTPSNGQNIHPILNRAITPREAARLQSFPDRFSFCGSKTSVCKQIGNAVPPLMAKGIGEFIISRISEIRKVSYSSGQIYFADSSTIDPGALGMVDAIITDPPYAISKKNNFRTLKNRSGIFFGEWDSLFDTVNWIDSYSRILKPGGSMIVFCSYLHISFICKEMARMGLDVKDAFKWIKSNPMPRNTNRRYVQDTEFAVWAIKPGKWVFNKPKNTPYLRAQFSSATVLGKERFNHPTQKSLALMKHLIEVHTNKGDLILDPFMGSGTTCCAAADLGRKFIGIESEEKYFQIAELRLADHAVKKLRPKELIINKTITPAC